MKYQLITYTGTGFLDKVTENTDDKNVFDRFAQAVSKGKFATLNERGDDGSYKTIKLYHTTRSENKKNKPL